MSVRNSGPTPITIDLHDPVDRHRYACPRGHRNWERTDGHFWCQSCSRSWDVDPEFDELHDLRSGELVERDRIRFAAD